MTNMVSPREFAILTQETSTTLWESSQLPLERMLADPPQAVSSLVKELSYL
jgi:hypothetical protein